jgi:hypothetical protein
MSLGANSVRTVEFTVHFLDEFARQLDVSAPTLSAGE